MKLIFKICGLAVLLIVPSVESVLAQEIDQQKIQQLVREEIDRLVNTEGALDEAIKKGIESYVNNQRKSAEQARYNDQIKQAKNLRPVSLERDHILGDPEATVSLIEYSDFECPFCKRFHPTVDRLISDNKGKVRWIYRHFPLDFHNPGAQKQAEASECVAKISGNDAFWLYSDLIYKRTKSNGKGFPVEALTPLAVEIGVDKGAFTACYESGEMTARVIEDVDDGKKVGVSGTPAAFLINTRGEVRFVAGAMPLDRLQAFVDELSE
jgi:protein-disulfide isomerase